jgi:hypothetical protein
MNALNGARVRALDQDVGSVSDFYFDDERWVVRYVVVDTGWTRGAVLISPIAITRVDRESGLVEAALTADQIRKSPPPTAHRPVSRQFERNYADYYGYLPYWGGPRFWATSDNPRALAPDIFRATSAAPPTREDEGDHLRSSVDVRGHHIRATDGTIGHVDDFLVDDETWAIRFLRLDTSNWIGGRAVVIPRDVVKGVDWPSKTIDVRLSRAEVEHSPAYDPAHIQELATPPV